MGSRIYRYYNCTILKVVDGDTVDIHVDLGMTVSTIQRFRLYGIDAPETRGESRDLGRSAKNHLTMLLDAYDRWSIRTYKDSTDKYGRYLCSIFMPNKDGEDDFVWTINEQMVRDGHAITRFW